MQMPGNWWVQQGLFGSEFERWSILRNESDVEEIHILKSEIKHHIE